MTNEAGTRARPKPGLIGGLLSHWRGLDFIMRRPRLFPLVIVPVAVNTLLFVVFFLLSLRYFGRWLDSLLPQSDAWYWIILFYVMFVIFLAFLLLAAIFTFTAAANILASPFNDALSERTELIVTGAEEKPFSIKAILMEAGRTVIEELKKIAFFLVVFLALLLFNLLPVIGQFVYVVLMAVFTIFWLGLSFMDYTFARHKYKFGAKLRFVGKNFTPVFGYGLGVFVWLLVPLFNLVLIPVAVVGGTLLYLDLLENSKIP